MSTEVVETKAQIRHSKKMANAWATCESFNSQYPVGTKVRYRSLLDQPSQYDIKESVTRSEAWAMPCGEAVVMIQGKAGGISLKHVEVLPAN